MRGSLAERLAARTERTATCWIFHGSTQSKGYRQVYDYLTDSMVLAHRAAWEIANGPIPDGMTVDHMCETKTCVRPDHLHLVTRGRNTRLYYERRAAEVAAA